MPYTHLSLKERFLIHKHLQAGRSLREIAGNLGRHHTTASREIKRNRGKRGYPHKQANKLANRRRRKASPFPRKMTEALWAGWRTWWSSLAGAPSRQLEDFAVTVQSR